jgi:hypothetical protein
MSVLIEALCVVLKASSVIEKFAGGFEAFAASVPPGTLCADGELVRVGFMRAEDARAFIAQLERSGFLGASDKNAGDFVVVEAASGPLVPCDWMEFALVPWISAPLGPVAICKRPGSQVEPIVTPDGWEYQASLSKPPEWVIG